MSDPNPQAEYGEKMELMNEQCEIVMNLCTELRKKVDNDLYEIALTISMMKNNL